MKTKPPCRACFARQARHAAQLATPDPGLRQELVRQADLLLAGLDPEASPPVNSIALYQLISRLSGHPDPFARLKRQGNDLARRIAPSVRAMIAASADPLAAALRFALAGNIIDYGAQQDFDLDAAVAGCLKRQPAIDHYPLLGQELARARQVLYLADNCGEIVFDGLLIEQLPAAIEVILAVKGGPIINDATRADAISCGLDRRCRVIDNGTQCPGTPLDRCPPEFVRLFYEAEVVISKGQGNFETLSEGAGRTVYHLLTVKCPVVGEHVREVSGQRGEIGLGATVILRL